MRLSVHDLTFAYTQKPVLNKVSFSLETGDFLAIIGKNGSGKSTLVKCLLGLLKVPNNTIFLDDADINSMVKTTKIGYVPQKADFNIEFPITVKEVLTSSYQGKRDQSFTSIINDLEINRFYYDNINCLSGGQLQRIFIARALLNQPKLLILDEPTAGVDQSNLLGLQEILKKLKNQKITIIMITHHLEFATELADYLLHLDEILDYSFEKVGEGV
ncbi:MAG: metal ABC transporter ATP-binding protein [Bacilli bacterium]